MRPVLIRALFRALAALPLWGVQALGWLVGSVAALLPNRERRNAEVNLEPCASRACRRDERRRFLHGR